MRIETDSPYYYDVLNIYDRLCQEIVKKYGYIAKATKILGKSPSFLHSPDHVGSVNNLFDICNKLDLDFGYILNGNSYRPSEINLDKLLKAYNAHRYKTRIPNSIKAIISTIRNGKAKNIKLATLLYLSDLLKSNPFDLI